MLYIIIFQNLWKKEEICIKLISRLLIFADELTKALLIARLKKQKELWRLIDKNELLRKKKICKKRRSLLSLHT